MNKQILGLAALIILATTACKKNDDQQQQTVGISHRGGPFVDTVTLPLTIGADRVLTNDTLYVLDGKCYVTNNAVLTVQEGATIEAERKSTNDSASALVITRGSQLVAEATAENPIVFTSHETTPASGDWGGIVLLGRAPLNRADATIEGINLVGLPAGVDVNYGGGGAGLGDADDNSGVLRFVVIEYAGAAIAPDNELNGLTCGGVGRGTVLDFIEVALGNDDAYEFFGGTVDAKHLIAFSPDDDAFDFDQGYSGNIQFAVSVLREVDNFSANPNGIESDNDATGTDNQPRTKAVISNMTVLGLETSASASSHALLNGAMFRRNSSFIVRNSVYAGFPTGLNLSSAGTIADVGLFQFNTVHGFSAVDVGASIDGTNTEILGGNANNGILLVSPFTTSAPDFRPAANSPLLTAGTNFTGLPSFFDVVTYRGAFDLGVRWDAGWAKYDF